MKCFICSSVIIIFIFLAKLCLADIPKLINYQGMLTNNSGDPLTGTYDITFKIYNASSGGIKRWEETQTDVAVTNGLFNVILGGATVGGMDLDFSEEYWLDITVEGEHISERLKFTSVGYAYRARIADTATVALSTQIGGGWMDDGTVVRLLTTADSVGIGTGTPKAKLDLRGTLNVGMNSTGYDVNFYGGFSGSRVYWNHGKMAFRAGGDSDGSHWAHDSTGYFSLALGYNTLARGSRSIALGNSVAARGSYSTAIGDFATAGGDESVAIGQWVTANSMNSMVVGQGSGFSTPLVNNVPNSLMVGFASEQPTLFVDGSGVGIGTTSPDERLHVENPFGDNSAKLSCADGYLSSLKLFEGADYGYEFQYAGSEDKLHLWSRKFSGNEGIRMTWLKDGRVGIGTTDPMRDLHVAGSGYTEIQLEKTDEPTNKWHLSLWENGLLFVETDADYRLTLENGGNVGIGTTNPNYKLDVNGDINVAGSYNVYRAGDPYNHPDYVFEPDYQLMPLNELRKYIIENKTLPNVISAEDVKKNNGFKIDELLIQMLEKIEEQTLYIFQLEERIDDLEKEIEERK